VGTRSQGACGQKQRKRRVDRWACRRAASGRRAAAARKAHRCRAPSPLGGGCSTCPIRHLERSGSSGQTRAARAAQRRLRREHGKSPILLARPHAGGRMPCCSRLGRRQRSSRRGARRRPASAMRRAYEGRKSQLSCLGDSTGCSLGTPSRHRNSAERRCSATRRPPLRFSTAAASPMPSWSCSTEPVSLAASSLLATTSSSLSSSPPPREPALPLLHSLLPAARCWSSALLFVPPTPPPSL